MTKQHFDKLAWELAKVEPYVHEAGPDGVEAHDAWGKCVNAVSGACKSFNPGFKEHLFKEACHYEYWETHKQPK